MANVVLEEANFIDEERYQEIKQNEANFIDEERYQKIKQDIGKTNDYFTQEELKKFGVILA